MLWFIFFLLLIIGGISNLLNAVASRCDDWLNERNNK